MKKVIAIDGPAGAGKSTLARRLATKLGFTYIDTGAMYRAAAWQTLSRLADKNAPFSDDFIVETAEHMTITLTYADGVQKIAVDGEDVSEAIRTPEVTAIVSRVAAIKRVREIMVKLQREMAKNGGVVMDGRDIASNVLPSADVKIFLTATPEERARRRQKEMLEKGFAADFEKIKADIIARDKADSERAESPLLKVPEAVLLDTTSLNLEETEMALMGIINNES